MRIVIIGKNKTPVTVALFYLPRGDSEKYIACIRKAVASVSVGLQVERGITKMFIGHSLYFNNKGILVPKMKG